MKYRRPGGRGERGREIEKDKSMKICEKRLRCDQIRLGVEWKADG